MGMDTDDDVRQLARRVMDSRDRWRELGVYIVGTAEARRRSGILILIESSSVSDAEDRLREAYSDVDIVVEVERGDPYTYQDHNDGPA
jgi:hypothetical protein